MYYILEGTSVKPVSSVIEWGKWFEDADRILKQDTLGNGRFISTVFLGIDHNFAAPMGRPLLFESMVFPDEQLSGGELDCQRYSTWAQAIAGHEDLVAKWKDK